MPALVAWAESVDYRDTKSYHPQVWGMKEKRKNNRMSKKNKKNFNGQSEQDNAKMEREDRMELRGVVEDALPGTWFKVLTETNTIVLATLGGKLRQNHIRILPGDQVIVEVSPYDLSRGRISWRA
jgi:translation initiation factor IF-1